MQLSTHLVVRSMSTISVPPMYVRYVFRVYIFSFYCALFSSFSLSHSLSLSIFSTISSFWCLCCGLSLCVFFLCFAFVTARARRGFPSNAYFVFVLFYDRVLCALSWLHIVSKHTVPSHNFVRHLYLSDARSGNSKRYYSK